MKAKDRRKAEAEKKRRRWKFNGGNKYYLDIGVFHLACRNDPPLGWGYQVGLISSGGAADIAGGSGGKDLVEAKVQALSTLAEYLGSCMKQVSEVEDPICG
jgi:hypothetical protein